MFNVQHHDVHNHGIQNLDVTLYESTNSPKEIIDLTWSSSPSSSLCATKQSKQLYSSYYNHWSQDNPISITTPPTSSNFTIATTFQSVISNKSHSHISPRRFKSARHGGKSPTSLQDPREMSAMSPLYVPRSINDSSLSSSRRYLLHILQQPLFGCAFGSKLLSRLAIAPSLIVKLQVIDLAGRELNIDDLSPFLICQVSLLSDTGTIADILEPIPADKESIEALDETMTTTTTSAAPVTRAAAAASINSQDKGETSVRMLYGTLTASLQKLQLPNSNRLDNLFIFPEISIRSRGRFRLQVNLMQLPLPLHNEPKKGELLASICTEIFPVVLSSEYIAPAVTPLSRHLAEQGVKLLIPSNHNID